MKKDLNDRSWPIPAAQAIKSIRARPTATCDPLPTFSTFVILLFASRKADIRRLARKGKV